MTGMLFAILAWLIAAVALFFACAWLIGKILLGIAKVFVWFLEDTR